MNINKISKMNDNDIQALAELDENGFIIAPGEDAEKFKLRVLAQLENVNLINNALQKSQEFDLEGICKLKLNDKIPPEIMNEASLITNKAYGFKVDWVPGFFMSKSLGPLWGGCSVLIPEISSAVFLIRSSFRQKKRWLLYRRDELLAHEICHSARMPLADRIFDENFAYSISPSRLRRNFGGSFRTEADALVFVLPVFLLLIVQLLNVFTGTTIPIIPFWIVALLCPAYLIIRNFIASISLSRAAKKLSTLGFTNPYAVLFRSSADEILLISSITNEHLSKWLKEKKENELRWKIIFYRFAEKNSKFKTKAAEP